MMHLPSLTQTGLVHIIPDAMGLKTGENWIGTIFFPTFLPVSFLPSNWLCHSLCTMYYGSTWIILHVTVLCINNSIGVYALD